jgi:hypothetical protein
MIDEVRRIVTEAIIPYVANWNAKRNKRKELGGSGDKKEYRGTPQYIEQKEMEEVEAATYDPFDDYLEMMVTFGYVTLFAAAFPMASLISVVMIYFESRSDLFKLEKLVRRPRVKKAYSIGSWIYVLEFMAVTSIFTNIILFTYASDQIEHLLPFMKGSQAGGVLTIFTIEHIMVGIVVLLRVFLDKDPRWVALFKQRMAYKKEQKSLKTLSRARTA